MANMPDEEVLEEGLLNPAKPETQDPLLQAILAENEAPATAPTELEQPAPLPAHVAAFSKTCWPS